MRAIADWIEIDEKTYVKRVPGGMVMRNGWSDFWTAVYIPCTAESFIAFLEANGVPMAPFEIVAPSPKIVT